MFSGTEGWRKQAIKALMVGKPKSAAQSQQLWERLQRKKDALDWSRFTKERTNRWQLLL